MLNDYNATLEEQVIMNSKVIRRLKQKTQVRHNIKTNVHITERLTHSIEVGVTAKLILLHLQKQNKYILPINPSQLYNVCLLHDVGHPPLGHEFETALNKVVKNEGIFFEGNANNIRVIDKEDFPLSNLTKVSLIKYPKKITKEQKKGLYEPQYKEYIPILIKEFIKQQKKLMKAGIISKKNKKFFNKILSLDTSNGKEIQDLDFNKLIEKYNIRTLEAILMEEADDITYLTHDFKDYILYIKDDNEKIQKELYEDYKDNKLVQLLLNSTKKTVGSNILKIRNVLISGLYLDFEKNKIKYSDSELKELKEFLYNFTYKHFIMRSNKQIHEIMDVEKYIKYMLSKINNREFIEDYVYSDTYKELILNSDNDVAKKKYMINAIAEKTDKWLLSDYNTHKKFFL